MKSIVYCFELKSCDGGIPLTSTAKFMLVIVELRSYLTPSAGTKPGRYKFFYMFGNMQNYPNLSQLRI